ncbi:hypothetical protein CHU92_07110 [Flavobacterium cyanobacteriorum]|uniref:Signal transduction histidine kinase internal region domain-containing protein n=1 Tax=Flavobacterium cyanobacteriorum TaxID=2022802 RepID=A0A255ZAV2_9FLAO|nr:histidine kinase [Flavobacterium cyanobacteriorum]OYQ37985.1 hypothetical protein CHU92_07110 [Flavobacterium cyanobacteriorum]
MTVSRNFKLAAAFSPVLGLFGLSPVLLFQKLPLSELALIFCVLTTGIFTFWNINLYITRLFAEKPMYVRYGISYLTTFIIHSVIIGVGILVGASNPPVSGISTLYPILSLLFINTFILIIIDVVRLQEAKAAARIEINNLKIANLEAQKQLLVQQLQPHFLFNTLATLKSLIHEDPAIAEKYTLKLSDFMRYSTHGNHGNTVKLSDEVHFTKSYIELQQYRFGKALQYSEDIAQELLTSKIPVFALQLLAENAVKHNYFTPENPLLIKVYNDGSKVCVTNNKTGLRLTERSGLGLKNLNERLLLLTAVPLEKEEDEHFFTVKITVA